MSTFNIPLASLKTANGSRFTRGLCRRIYLGMSSVAGSLLLGAALTCIAEGRAVAEEAVKPVHNVVLVHGAWADGSSWSKVIPILEAKGLHVVAVQNPLSSLADDVAATKRAMALMDGPVILVGHSYGGAVITEAGSDPQVAGLVYVAAFAPDSGEAVGEMGKGYPPAPGGAEVRPDKAGFLSITTKGYMENFCQDLPLAERKVLAATQGPTAGAAFGAKISNAAWHTKPSWYVVATGDRMIQPAFEQAMAAKISAKKVISVGASHAAMLSKPSEVAALILDACGISAK